MLELQPAISSAAPTIPAKYFTCILFPIINELDVLSVSESYTKKMTKRKTPGHFCPGVSQFWEISTQIILVAGRRPVC
ncbi:hypothetical protein E4M47_03820 [Salmonella enterica]|nr:hypothetical protein [Salmonella enterica]